MNHSLRRALAFAASVLLAAGLLQLGAVSATAAAPGHANLVSEAPAAWTPAVNDGSVRGYAQTGSTMVAIGDFSSVTPAGGAAVARSRAFAFNATTGALVTGFAPSFNGAVNDVFAGPTDGTVYVAGSFTQVNGTNRSRIALLNVSNGSLVTSFATPNINGVVNTIAVNGNRLYAGGNFTSAANAAHGGLASFNATTGAIDNFVNNQVADRHNDTGSGAQGAVGVRDLEVTPDGSKMAAIGNFKRVDGLERDQLVVMNLSGSSAVVTSDWRTRRYEPYCFNWAFDTYVRGVSISPDGSYFVVTATGGQNGGTLCDTAARFEFGSTGQEIQPTWVDYSGGDTLWGVEVTEQAVYVGGHQRWLNNSNGSDFAGPGAVSRPGLAALDTKTGLPLKWNAGRNPRGAAVYTLESTSAGLWLGSDTDFIGPRYRYKRPKLAFFPVSGGATVASDRIATVPGTAYLGAPRSSNNGNILYRVNAGGSTIPSVDNGPDWSSDDSDPSSYRNSQSNSAGWASGATTDNTVPASTPNAVFDSERWSPTDSPSMQWAFPAPAGAPLQVRLFFANRYSGTSGVGQRVFDVSLDGTKVLDDFDIAATTGDQRGTMKSFDITSDGTVDIDFTHVTENPLINAIEIVRTDQAPPTAPEQLRSVQLSSGGAGAVASLTDPNIDFTQWRGSFLAGGKVWYGKADGTFNSRTFSAGSFGSEVGVNPYDDPDWDGVDTGSNNTYDGNAVALYGQLSSVTAMAYTGGRLFYTKAGDGNLYWRWFSTDSGIIGSEEFTANAGRSWSGTQGMFATSSNLYFVLGDGSLNSIGLSAGVPDGGTTFVDGPSTSGVNWRARALFLGDSTLPPPNVAPTAAFTTQCTDLVCTFDASDSSDSDGTIASYTWDFAGTAGSGQVAQHEFASEGTYPVKLTVKDDDNATGTVTKQVQVEVSVQPEQPIGYVGSAVANANNANPSVAIPSGVQVGDLLVLTASVNNTPTVTTPTGWTKVDGVTNVAMSSYVFTKTATASDLGSSVQVPLSALGKTALAVTSYRNAKGVSASATNTDSGTASHGTPEVTAPSGSWVTWFWAEKSASTSSITPGSGVTKRAEVYSAGSGRVAAFVGDTNGARAGVVAGTVATADTTSSRAINWSLVIEPNLSAPAPNVDPTASFANDCSGLTCTFTSTSNDPDGSIASQAWDFNPGSGSNAVQQHTFAAAGTYTVSLTVTDNAGATANVSRQITVSATPPASDPISFVDSATANANSANPSVAIPAATQTGDLLLLTATLNNTPTVTTPSGWTLVRTESTSGVSSYVFSKVASAGDAGKSVPVALSALGKSALAVTAYRNAAGVGVTAVSTDSATATHTAPDVTAPAGSWVVWYVAEKSAGTSSITGGPGVTKRAEVYSTGSGRVSAYVGDAGGPQTGTVAGGSATADTTSSRAVNWSIVLQPAT